jgi:DtxR family Mn-dependent transcriptional regulator
MDIGESAENYLETIYILKKRMGKVRSIDVANKLGFSKPTISERMKEFRSNGYINVDEDGYIELSDKGLWIADRMFNRHNIIAQMFMWLGVDEETAFVDACAVEHDLSEKTFNCLKAHFEESKRMFERVHQIEQTGFIDGNKE